MASQVPGFDISLSELAMALLSASEVVARARLIAQQVAELVPGSGVVVYVIDRSGEPVWVPKATAGEVAFEEPQIPLDFGTLGALSQKREPVSFSGVRLRREQYNHLNVRRTLVSLVGLPMVAGDELVGAFEVLTFNTPLHESSLPPLVELARLGALGISAGLAYESERNTSLESITRLTQLYDLERTFNSTLEMENLLPLITSKYQELLNVQAVNLWMVEDEGVRLMSRAGTDPTVELDAVQSAGGGLSGDLAESGEAVLINADSDERLQRRNERVEEGAIFSLMAAPLMHDGAEVGLVECINKTDGAPFDDDDLFFLTTINETASSALHNASLLQAERKVEILETLVSVSHEITSTLNLDRVLQTLVNAPQAVIPYERAAIAVEQRGKFRLGAISGMYEVHTDDPDVKPLNGVLQWASASTEAVFVCQRGERPEAEREETIAKFQKYFAETGMRGFYAVPLVDDDGCVGILSFESRDPDFLSQAHLEMIQVIAAQATVALRNAALYKEVPFIDFIQPMLEKKRKFLSMEKSRRAATLGLAAAVVAFATFFPIPMRIAGSATVAPVHTAQVQPELEGIVKGVYVRESDSVKRGTILADLEDWEYRMGLAGAQAKYGTAISEMNRALAGNDGTQAGILRVQADFWAAEVARARERVEKTHIRSPIDGVVTTPHVENFVGRRLAYGEKFAEVVDLSHATVDVAVDEDDVPLLWVGERAAVKLEGFPTRRFKGDVVVVSPKGGLDGNKRVFFARVLLPNPDGVIRAGMQGRAKVSVGWHAVGYVLFRGPAIWLYSKLWSWFGW
jgi:RND family efflux transporter MFP subunit